MIVSELESLFSLRIDQNSFRKADNAVASFAGKAEKIFQGIAGAFLVNQIFGFINGLVQAGSALEDVSKRIGITTNALQELQFAAGQDGVSAGELEGALRRLSASAFQAAEGGEEAKEVYRKLGVSVKNADGSVKNSEQLLADVAQGFQRVTNPTERAALAMKVFGRSGTALIPFLEKGSANIEEMRQRFRDLGGGFSEEFVKNADEVGDKMDELKILNQSFKSQLGNILLPVISSFITKLTDLGIWLNKVLKGTEYLKFAFYAVAAASVAAGVAAISPWLPALALWLGIGVAIASVLAVIEDLYALITGKKSLIGQWLDEWAGVGAANEFVNNFRIGVDSLATSLQKVWQFGNDVIEMFARLGASIGGSWFEVDIKDNEKKRMAVQERMAKFEKEVLDDVVAAGKGWVAAMFPEEQPKPTAGATYSQTYDPEVMDTLHVAAGRGVNAPLRLDPSIPRAARGAQGALVPGSVAFGQATAAATRGQAGDSVQNTVNVTVHSQTNADPKEIARVAKEQVMEGLNQQNRNLRAAHTSRSPR